MRGRSSVLVDVHRRAVGASPISVLTLLLSVIGCAAVAVAGFALTRRLRPSLSHESNNELIRIASSVTSSLYGLLLAFIVVTAYQGYTEARTRTEDEVAALSAVMRGSGGLPDDLRRAIRADTVLYAERVVAREWSSLANGDFDPLSRATYERIWSRLYAARNLDEHESAFFSGVLDYMHELGRARRLRIYSSQSSVPPLLWALIGGGAVLAIGLLYLYGDRRPRVQGAVIGVVAGFIGAVLFLIYALDAPFGGALRLSSESFTYFIDQWPGPL